MNYWMHKEYGHLVPENELMKDAQELELDDITDPCSIEYGNFNLYYEKTTYPVAQTGFIFFRCLTSKNMD